MGKLHLLLPTQRGGMPTPSGMPHFFLAFADTKTYRLNPKVFMASLATLSEEDDMQSGRFYFYRWYYGILSGRKRDGDAY